MQLILLYHSVDSTASNIDVTAQTVDLTDQTIYLTGKQFPCILALIRFLSLLRIAK